jgi:oligopeptide transport system substrate-binding protein
MPYVLSALTHQAFQIVPIHALKIYGAQWTQPKNFVGNGPFVLKEWTPNDKIVCVKNPKYWDAKNVKIDQLVFVSTEDDAVSYRMYVNGEVDWNTNSPPADKIDEAKARPQKDFYTTPIMTVYYYEFATMRPPFNDLRVRKAFSMSMGRKDIAEKITKTGEIPTTNYVMPMGGYTGPVGIPEDVEMAKKLLADAGYPGGKGFPVVKLGYNTSSRHKSIAEFLQQRWEQVLGVKVELTNMDFATFLDVRKDGNLGGFDIARAGWQADYMDPYNFLFMFLSDNVDFNDPRWKNAKYDELILKSNTLPAGAERNKLFFDAEKLLVEDLPIAPMLFYTSQNMIDLNKWGGWSSNALDRHAPKFFYKK